MNEGSHWYLPDGSSCHEVPNKSKGGMRPTKITDARKMGLLPSVTTYFRVLAKPELDRWKQQQVLMAALTLPKQDGESDEDYCNRIMEDAFKQVDDAADLGTRVHQALEFHFQGLQYDPELRVYVDAVEAWVKENGVTFLKHELRIVSMEHGYAGTTDARITACGGSEHGTLDFKTRKSKPQYPMSPWSTEPMQIAAYGKVEGSSFGVNVYISTTEPGRVEATWYDKARLDKEFEAFTHVMAMWRHLHSYDPRTN